VTKRGTQDGAEAQDRDHHPPAPKTKRGWQQRRIDMGKFFHKRKFIAAALACSALVTACSKAPEGGNNAAAPAGGDIKVGILHSLSGTMAIS
jgi:hypothetical protein